MRLRRCTNIFGHKFGPWKLEYGAPKKEPDGLLYKQKMQERVCSKCNFTVTDWVNSWKLVEEKPELEIVKISK